MSKKVPDQFREGDLVKLSIQAALAAGSSPAFDTLAGVSHLWPGVPFALRPLYHCLTGTTLELPAVFSPKLQTVFDLNRLSGAPFAL